VLLYFITFTRKCFTLAEAAVSAKLRQYCWKKSAKFYTSYVRLCWFCTQWIIPCMLANSEQNSARTEFWCS